MTVFAVPEETANELQAGDGGDASANDDVDSLDFTLESRPLGMPEVHVPGSQFGGESLLEYVRQDRDEQAAKRKQGGDKAKKLRPRWRLCFKIDQKPAKQSLGDAWKYSKDFYVTIVDPPTAINMDKGRSPPKSSVFASETACLIADMLASWNFLSLMQNKSYEGKVCLAVGKQCLVGGLVMAMLGAKVIFVCADVPCKVRKGFKPYAEKQLQQHFDKIKHLPNCEDLMAVQRHVINSEVEKKVRDYMEKEYSHFQQNIRIFRESLDYTQIKSDHVVVLRADHNNYHSMDMEHICELVDSPGPADIILSTEQDLAFMGAHFIQSKDNLDISEKKDEAADDKAAAGDPVEEVQHTQNIFGALAQLVPDRAHTAALIVCPFNAQGEVLDIVSPSQDWQEKQFCTVADKLKVFLVERTELEERRPQKKWKGFRRYLAPMGAPSPKCGCGGHPQQSFLNHRIANSAWHENNENLKLSLQRFNEARKQEQYEDAEECKKWIEAQRSHRQRLAKDGKNLYRQSMRADKLKVPPSPGNMFGHQVPPLSGFGFSAMSCSERSVSETPSISEEPGSFPRTRLARNTPRTGKDGKMRPTSTLEKPSHLRSQASPGTLAMSPPEGHIADARPNTAPEGASRGSRFKNDPQFPSRGLGETSLQESSIMEEPTGKESSIMQGSPMMSRQSMSKYSIGSKFSGSTMSGSSIHERHHNPPFWYRCNRVPYGPATSR